MVETFETDVVVVGCGISGLAAAVTGITVQLPWDLPRCRNWQIVCHWLLTWPTNIK